MVRQSLEKRGIRYGPAFTGLAAVHTAEGKVATVLAEVGLPGPVRPQQAAYGVHPALLDACFQSVAAHPALMEAADGGLLLPLGVGLLRSYEPARDARYCYTRLTKIDGTAVEADLDVLDAHGTVLLSVRGLRMGTGAGEGSERDRVLAERLMTIDWQQRALPKAQDTAAGTWLVIAADADDALATRLIESLKSQGAQCKTVFSPQGTDHLRAEGVRGVVVLSPPPLDDPDDQCVLRGREHVRHLVRIARQLPDVPGEPPRLYIVTRGAQSVLADDPIDLDQAGLRGLLRVVGAEYPQLRATQIDVDSDIDTEQLVSEFLSGSDDDEIAWRGGRRYAARLRPSPLRADERRIAMLDNEIDGMRLEVRTPGDLETVELVAFDRRPPGPGQIEVGVDASSVNFADVLAALGRQPSIDGAGQSWASISPAW